MTGSIVQGKADPTLVKITSKGGAASTVIKDVQREVGLGRFFGKVEKPEAILGQISQFRFWTCSAHIVEPLLNWKV